MSTKMKVIELEINSSDFAKFHKTCDYLFLADADYKDWCYRATFRKEGSRNVLVKLIYDDERKLFRLAWLFGRGI